MLRKSYGPQVAVDDISFSVGKGEIVGFLGPNGAGKSTTMKMLTGFIPPDSGSASVAGFGIGSFSREGRRKVGYLPENNPLYGHMFVCEYLDFAAGLNGIQNRNQRIPELLALTGLEPERNKRISQLSKGYRQRVGLAQALLADPDVLILDEPTSGLDPNQLADIRKLIRNAGNEKTILLSTHIMQEVEQMCDRVIIINQGHIVADESVAELSRRSSGDCHMEVGFERAPSEEELTAIPFNVVQKKDDKHFVFSGTDEAHMSKTINRLAVEQGNAVLRLNAVRQNLEDIFRELTSKNDSENPIKNQDD